MAARLFLAFGKSPHEKMQARGNASVAAGAKKAPSRRPVSHLLEPLENRQMMSASLLNGGVVSGSIAAPNQTQHYVFSAAAGAKLQLETQQGNSPGFLAVFKLQDAAGHQVAAWNGNNYVPEQLAGGQYTLSVSAYNHTASGDFSIGLEGISPISPSPSSLVYGGVVNGSISGQLDVKEYVFTASANSKVHLRTLQGSTPGFLAQFTLYDKAGNQVTAWNGNNYVPQTLSAGGQYMLKVSAYSRTATGSYSIGLEGVSPISPSPLSLSYGGVINGGISSPLDVKEYVFSAGANAKVQFETLQSSTPGFLATFTVYDSAGNQVTAWNGNNYVPQTLSAGGQYMLRVSAYDQTSTGTYSIGLEGINPISPSPLSLVRGGTVGGAVSGALDVKEYVFSANAGSKVQLQTQQSTTPGFLAQFVLYDQAGNQVAAWNGNNKVPATLMAGGRYMLRVSAYNRTSTGTYSVALS